MRRCLSVTAPALAANPALHGPASSIRKGFREDMGRADGQFEKRALGQPTPTSFIVVQ